MALSDYRLCDRCEGKAFYDAHLNYETGSRGPDGKWHAPKNPFRVSGSEQFHGHALDRIGDWAVLCTECAKTHKCIVVPIDEAAP